MGKYESTFNDLQDAVMIELAKDSDLVVKITKVKYFVSTLHSIYGRRFSQEYAARVIEIKRQMTTDITFAGNQLQQKRLDLLVEWFNLILEEYPLYDLYKNFKRVKFGA